MPLFAALLVDLEVDFEVEVHVDFEVLLLRHDLGEFLGVGLLGGGPGLLQIGVGFLLGKGMVVGLF